MNTHCYKNPLISSSTDPDIDAIFGGQTLLPNTLYVPLKRFPLPVLRDWRRVEIIKRSKQMICKDHRRLDPCLNARPSFCTAQKEESTNLIFFFFASLQRSSFISTSAGRISNQTTLDGSLRAYR